jgi:hypothetical protein
LLRVYHTNQREIIDATHNFKRQTKKKQSHDSFSSSSANLYIHNGLGFVHYGLPKKDNVTIIPITFEEKQEIGIRVAH